MSEPREKTPTPADRPEGDEDEEQQTEETTRERPDYKGQDLEGGMPLREYDMYRDMPGERAGG